MSNYEYVTKSFVTSDGSYGSGDVLTFEYDSLTAEQWDVVSDLNDNDRFEFILACLDNDEVVLAEYADYL